MESRALARYPSDATTIPEDLGMVLDACADDASAMQIGMPSRALARYPSDATTIPGDFGEPAVPDDLVPPIQSTPLPSTPPVGDTLFHLWQCPIDSQETPGSSSACASNDTSRHPPTTIAPPVEPSTVWDISSDWEISKCQGSPNIILPDVLLTCRDGDHMIEKAANSVVDKLLFFCQEFYIGVSSTPHTRFYDETIGHVHRGWKTMELIAEVSAPLARKCEKGLIAAHMGNDLCTNKGKGGEHVPKTCDGFPRFLYVLGRDPPAQSPLL